MQALMAAGTGLAAGGPPRFQLFDIGSIWTGVPTWALPFALLLIASIVAFPLSRYAAWIMDGKYRPLARRKDKSGSGLGSDGIRFAVDAAGYGR
jgi:hypothetical protein